jgi:hypothetical protein
MFSARKQTLVEEPEKKQLIIKRALDTIEDSVTRIDILSCSSSRKSTSAYPYLTRQVPKSWHTSNGNFTTKGRG